MRTLGSKGRVPKAKLDSAALSLLNPQLREIIDWPRRNYDMEGEPARTATGAIWRGIPHGHKWVDYFPIYDREFSSLRGTRPKILEIGVYKGASLKLWKEFFAPGCTIVGIDIDEECRQYSDEKNGVHVRIGSQADAQFLKSINDEFGPFDLIIDDGSHFSSHQIASFNALFENALSENGIYFIEDLECVYWGHTTGHLDQDVSAMDFLKMLVDLPHYIFTEHVYRDFAFHEPERKKAFAVPRIATMIESIKFYRGVAVVRKCKAEAAAVCYLIP